MDILYFTLAAIAIYLVANWLLDRIEVARGARFEYRTLIFFAIITTLAVGTFALIRALIGP